MNDEPPEKCSPEQRACAAQWLIEKRLGRLREKMPPAVFESWATALDLLLAPIEQIADQ